MKKVALLFISAIAAAFVGACGKSSNSNNNPINGIAVGPNGCPVGYYQSGTMCYPNGGTTSMTGTFFDFNYSANGYGTGSLVIRNAAAYKEFLKNAMGVCDRMTWTTGVNSCDSWVGGFLQISVTNTGSTNNQLTVQFRAWPQQSFISFDGSLGIDMSGAYRNPLALYATVSPINNWAGFQADAYGDMYTAANRTLISVMVRQGKLSDPSVNYEVYYKLNNQSVLMASGTMRKF